VRARARSTLDEGDHVVDDAQEVLLEEVGLEAVEGLLQVGGEEAQALCSLGPSRRRGCRRRPPVERRDLRQDLLRVLRADVALVLEVDGEVVEAGEGRLDLLLEEVGELLVEDLGRGRVPHAVTLGVSLGGVHVGGGQPLLLDPQPVDVVLEAQAGGKEGRKAEGVVIGGHAAVHPPVLLGQRRSKVHQHVHVLELVEVRSCARCTAWARWTSGRSMGSSRVADQAAACAGLADARAAFTGSGVRACNMGAKAAR
jgi:hypothetical protein